MASDLKERSRGLNIFLVIVLALGGYCGGFHVAIFNSMGKPILEGRYGFTGAKFDDELGNLSAMFPIGSLLGCLLGPQVMNFFGRRATNIGLDLSAILLFALGLVEHLYVLYAVRIGFGFVGSLYGMCAGITLVECFPKALAGLGNILIYSFVTFIILLSFVLQLVSPYEVMVDYWYIYMTYPIVIAIFRYLSLIFFYKFESPKFVLSQFNSLDDPQLRIALKRNLLPLYLDHNLDEHITDIIEEARLDASSKKTTLWEVLTQQAYRKPMISALIGNVGQQLSGINFFIFFSTELFDKINGQGKTISLAVGIGNFLGSFVSMLFVNRFKRVATIQGGTLIQGLNLAALLVGIYFEIYLILPLFVLIYLMAFAVGLGSTLGLYCNEILPPVGVGVMQALNWGFATLIGKLSPLGVKLIGGKSVLLVFAVLCGVFFIVIGFFCEEPRKAGRGDKASFNTDVPIQSVVASNPSLHHPLEA